MPRCSCPTDVLEHGLDCSRQASEASYADTAEESQTEDSGGCLYLFHNSHWLPILPATEISPSLPSDFSNQTGPDVSHDFTVTYPQRPGQFGPSSIQTSTGMIMDTPYSPSAYPAHPIDQAQHSQQQAFIQFPHHAGNETIQILASGVQLCDATRVDRRHISGPRITEATFSRDEHHGHGQPTGTNASVPPIPTSFPSHFQHLTDNAGFGGIDLGLGTKLYGMPASIGGLSRWREPGPLPVPMPTMPVSASVSVPMPMPIAMPMEIPPRQSGTSIVCSSQVA